MATLDYQHSFQNNTIANALEVMANFNKIKDYFETRVVQIDGSVKAGTAAIDNLAVTTDKIAEGAITVGKLAPGVAISGPTGPQGPQGPQGIQGPTGATGPQGPAGPGANQELNTYNNVTFNTVSTGGPIYAGTTAVLSNVGPSSADEVMVRISTGEIKKRTLSPWSLRELKEEITPVANALSKLKSLKPSTFRFKKSALIEGEPHDEFDRRTQLQYGFIVDEIQNSDVPDLVHYTTDDGVNRKPQSWKVHGVVSLAVAAIQELSEKVDALQAELDALKNG